MKPNYQYILELVQNTLVDTKSNNAKILDFGCGVGEVVESGLDMSLDIYGMIPLRDTMRIGKMTYHQISKTEYLRFKTIKWNMMIIPLIL